MGGTRQHHFDGTNFQPRNLPKNAATPTRRVHTVLGAALDFLIELFGEVFNPHRSFVK
jgi:hypothetical protein